jgi:hypothetical protein
MERTSPMHSFHRRGSLAWGLGALALVLAGCSGYFLASSKEGFEANEMKRAAFDLDCPAEQLVVTELTAGSTPITPDEVAEGGHGTVVGVSGCGRKATYKYVKEDGWMVQSAPK